MAGEYQLFQVAAFDPEEGTILVEGKTVSAKTQESAKNQVVKDLVTTDPEVDLDVVQVVVQPFRTF